MNILLLRNVAYTTHRTCEQRGTFKEIVTTKAGMLTIRKREFILFWDDRMRQGYLENPTFTLPMEEK